MMRITGLGSPNNVRRSGDTSRKPATGQAFQPAGASATQQSSQAVGAAPLQSIDALLALQSVDDVLTGRRRALKRGNEVLDTLEDLKIDLLSGTIAPAKLRRLLVLVEDGGRTGEDALDAVLDDIELRAKVELAKRKLL